MTVYNKGMEGICGQRMFGGKIKLQDEDEDGFHTLGLIR